MDQKRQDLLKAKLGDLLGWTKPEVVETIGPYDPSILEKYDTKRRSIVSDCTEKLRQYTEEEISVLVRERQDELPGTLRDWRDFLDDKIRRMNRGMPPWYAGGLGHPDHVADFDYWSRMARFTIHELLCLSVGIEPGSFEKRSIMEPRKGEFAKLWPPLQFLVRRREQLDRQFSLGTSNRVNPVRFLRWVERMEFEVHPEFLRLLRQYHSGGEISISESAAATRTDRREIDTIAQLFTAMAIEYYGYDPKQARSPIPKEITDLAASMGLSVSNDTVRKYLRLGASFIPDDWQQD
ncbi:hypothetical protein DDZ14_14970 [Maritimibacter sp. 55A14]|uniref:hypothetical protein n=1 Tax=Maritimibacter sp. 55A14 TaxID=2174844 RepID=UPI000D6063AA|nr:hypothetical protein [Maritimibacter sp. 55A14]PWE30587.1 hypothetical protein DDZ14_14970 [Maritimibacter sp. 55A14]